MYHLFWQEGDDIIAYRLRTLLTGSKNSSCLATQTLKKHSNKVAEITPALMETTKKLIESLYMDDSTLNEDDEDSAVETYYKARKICKAGGFELIKWESNSPALISSILTEDLVKTEMGLAGVISKAQKCWVFLTSLTYPCVSLTCFFIP